MADFDPDKYLGSKGGFDPDAYLASKDKSTYAGVPDEDLNYLQKLERAAVQLGLGIKPGYEMISPASLDQKKLALETAANTATFGYGPQIYGALKKMAGGDYLSSRDEAIDELNRAQGGTKAIGTTLGVLPTAFLKAPAALASLPGSGSALGRVLQSAGIGGAVSGLANPGDVKGEINPVQGGERTSNALLGSLLGGGLAGVIEAPGAIVNLGKMAKERALKASGFMLKDLRLAERKNMADTLGKAALDEGIVSPWASVGKIAHNAEDVMQKHGAVIGKTEKLIDSKFGELVQDPALAQAFPNASRMADEIESQIYAPLQAATGTEHMAPQIEKWVTSLRAKGNAPMSIARAKEELKGFDQAIDWNKVTPDEKQKLMEQIRGIMNKQIDESVGAIGEATKLPVLEQWRAAKQGYQASKTIADAAKDKVLRHQANNSMTPTDLIAGLSTATASGFGGLGDSSRHGEKAPFLPLVAGVLGGLAHHGAKTYGNSVLATGANRLQGMQAGPNLWRALLLKQELETK